MTTANQASCDTLVLRPGHVSLAELRRLSAGGVLLTLDPAALAGMLAAQAAFDYLPHRARLDLAGWADKDIFSHES